jgi:hypothetical protein
MKSPKITKNTEEIDLSHSSILTSNLISSQFKQNTYNPNCSAKNSQPSFMQLDAMDSTKHDVSRCINTVQEKVYFPRGYQ